MAPPESNHHSDNGRIADTTRISSIKNSGARTQWTYLTNHAHVLIALVRDPNARVRDLAEMVDITERAVQQILTDLEEAGVLTRERDGRRNRYSIDRSAPLRHSNEAGGTVHDLLALVDPGSRNK
jgi:DNA-binding transcriptional ArsR family regulator